MTSWNLALVNSELDDTKAQEVLSAVGKLPQLKRINLSKNKMTGASTEAFMGSVPFKSLEDLDVSNNQLDDAFLCALAEQLKQSANLQSLLLEGNQFGAQGASAFAAALNGSSITLPELNFSNNKLGDAGVQALLPLFEQISFKRVALAGNNITDASAVALADALAKTDVQEVDLSHNNISSKGAVALHNVMKTNGSLCTVRLSGNNKLVLDEQSAKLFSGSGFIFSDLTLSKA